MATHAVTTSPETGRRPKLSESEMKKAKAQVLSATMDLVHSKFETATPEEQDALTERIAAIKVR